MYPLIKSINTKQNIKSQRVYLNYYKKIFTFFFFTQYKNEHKEHKFCWQNNQKSDFYKNKKASQIDEVDVNKILVSKKEPYGTKNALKYFIGFNENDVIRPLCLRFPQMTGYVKKFNDDATMSFRANNKQLLKNYNKIWKKVEKLMRIDSESKPVYGEDDKYIKTKIKIYVGNMITNFHN